MSYNQEEPLSPATFMALTVGPTQVLGNAAREMERFERSRSCAWTGKQQVNEYQTCQQHLHLFTLGLGAPRLCGAPV